MTNHSEFTRQADALLREAHTFRIRMRVDSLFANPYEEDDDESLGRRYGTADLHIDECYLIVSVTDVTTLNQYEGYHLEYRDDMRSYAILICDDVPDRLFEPGNGTYASPITEVYPPARIDNEGNPILRPFTEPTMVYSEDHERYVSAYNSYFDPYGADDDGYEHSWEPDEDEEVDEDVVSQCPCADCTAWRERNQSNDDQGSWANRQVDDRD